MQLKPIVTIHLELEDGRKVVVTARLDQLHLDPNAAALIREALIREVGLTKEIK